MKSKNIASAIIVIAGPILFTWLLVEKHLDSGSYVMLMSGMAIMAILVHLLDRLKELDLKNLKITLAEISKVREDIYSKTEDLKKITVQLAQILLFNSAIQGRMNNKEGYRLWRDWYQKKITELLSTFSLTQDALDQVAKIHEKYRAIDETLGDGLKTSDPDYAEVKEKITRLADEAKDLIQRELTDAK